MATLGAIIIVGLITIFFAIAAAVANAQKRAASWRNMTIAERELGQAQDGIRRHAGADQTYKPRTIVGKR